MYNIFMASWTEKPSFKWWIIGSSFFLVLSIVLSFGWVTYSRIRQEERRQAEILDAERRYEDRFRNAMTRIYQNLKLDHFLAAYKNLENVPKIKNEDGAKNQEYLEVLYRIGNGLLQNQLLKESESVFLIVKEMEGQLTGADQALGKIESKRRIDNAKLFLSQGDLLLGQKRYREANQEYEKAHLELRSVENMKFDDVKDYWAHLRPKISEAKFYTLLEDAEKYIRTAEKQLKDKSFEELNQSMTRASMTLGRAAFFRPDAPEIAKARRRLVEIDSDMGFEIPNALPLWNLFTTEEQGKLNGFFFLKNYEFQPQINENHQVKIGLQFLLDHEEEYFIVRYRIFFANSRNIFNGHFIAPKKDMPGDQLDSVVFLQEVPDDLLKVPVSRIELRIYDAKDRVVSRIERAFRTS